MTEKQREQLMTGTNLTKKYNYLEMTIGNTDFLILFSESFYFKDQPWNSPAHYHLFCECHFVKNGTFRVKTENESRLIAGDAFLVIPNRLRHHVETVLSPIQKISFYVVISKNDEPTNETFEVFRHIFLESDLFVCEKENGYFNQILSLVQERKETRNLFEMKLRHLFSLAMIELFEQVGRPNEKNEEHSSLRYREEVLLKIESFMVESFSPDASLEDLASYLCLSARQTNRLLKQVFNSTFQEIKNQKRLESAKQLIRETELSLNEISERLGYGSYTGFHKMFRLQTGMSPEEYRLLDE